MLPPHNHKNFQSPRLLAKMAFSNRNVNVPCSQNTTVYINMIFQNKNLAHISPEVIVSYELAEFEVF